MNKISNQTSTYLKRLNEGPEKSPDPLSSAEQLYEAHHSKQPEKVDAEDVATRLRKKS